MLLSILPLIFIGITSFQLSTTAIKQQAISYAQESVNHKRDILDLHLEQIENLISDVSGVEEIVNAVSLETKSVDTYTRLATKARIGYILNGYLSLDGLLSIDIYTLDGGHYHVGETLADEKVREDIKSRLLTETLDSGKFIYWPGVENSINSRTDNSKVITAINLFTEVNLKTLEQEPIGLLVSNYSIESFSNALVPTAAEDKSYFVVIDKRNRIIHHPDKNLIGEQLASGVLDKVNNAKNRTSAYVDGQEVVINSAKFVRNGWQIVRFEPLEAMTRPAVNIGIITLAILAMCLLVISFTAYRFSRNVVVPIRKVTESFKAFGKGKFDPKKPIPVTGNDEIYELAKWYNTFLNVVAQQREAQTALAESETRFRDFAEVSSDWLWETDENNNISFVSNRFFDSINIDRDAIIGRSRITVLENASSGLAKNLREKHLEDLNAHRSFRLVYPITDKIGITHTVQSHGKPFYDISGQFLGYRGTATNISKEVEAEKALIELNTTLEKRVLARTSDLQLENERAERLVAAIDTLSEGVSIYDNEDRILFFNKKFAEVNQADPEMIQRGDKFEDHLRSIVTKGLVLEAVGNEEEWLEQRMRLHQNPKGSFEQARKNGVWLLLHEQRLPDGGSAILSADITQQKRLEEQVRRAQKMEAVGQLTGGIAHDFNNILGIIQGNLELLSDLSSNDLSLKFIENAQRGIDRGADITRKLLGFSRKDARKIKTVQVNGTIQNLEALIARSLTAYIMVETRLSEDLWSIAIDTGDFEDAVLNLSLNARDAMPEGGTLRIETQNKVLDADYVLRNPESRSGEYVMVSISDTGVGMGDSIRHRVFEPFFTTKEQGKGTGLGLSMVYGFMQRSNGHLNIYSEPGLGTTIHMFFPRKVEKAAVIVETLDQKSVLPIGTETILVVDDETELGDIAARHLGSLGYKTLSAESGAMALQLIKQHDDIDLVFSDVVMPGELDGYQLASMAHAHKPSLKFLLTSGFTKAAQKSLEGVDEFQAALISDVLSKPYNKSELAKAIRGNLDRVFPSNIRETED